MIFCDIIVAPPSSPQVAKPQTTPSKFDPLDEELISIIRENGRCGLPIWSLVNWVAEDQNPKNRIHRRATRLHLWTRLKKLIRSGKVFRYGRKCVSLEKVALPHRKTVRRSRQGVLEAAIRIGGSTALAKAVKGDEAVENPPRLSIPARIPREESQKTKSASTSEISSAARNLARLPRGQKREWTGYIEHVRAFRDMPVGLPDGKEGFIYGVRRGKAVITFDRGRLLGGPFDDGGPLRWTVLSVSQVHPLRNSDAKKLGSLKLGTKENPSALKAAAARRNGLRPVKLGNRPRGRPRKKTVPNVTAQNV